MGGTLPWVDCGVAAKGTAGGSGGEEEKDSAEADDLEPELDVDMKQKRGVSNRKARGLITSKKGVAAAVEGRLPPGKRVKGSGKRAAAGAAECQKGEGRDGGRAPGEVAAGRTGKKRRQDAAAEGNVAALKDCTNTQ